MKAVIFYVTRHEAHFRAVMEHKLMLSSKEKICASVKRLEQAQRRMGELDRLFIRIYEDNVAGRINDERFSMMSRSYETEQEQLKVEIQTLQQDIEVQERQIENLEQLSRGYTNTRIWTSLPRMLCGNLLREFILKLPTRAAANGGRTSAFPMILWFYPAE